MIVQTASKSAPESNDTSLQFGRSAMRTLITEHRARSQRVIDDSRERMAAYMTRFWEAFYGTSERQRTGQMLPQESRIEVNRLWSMTNTIASALYPTAARVALMPDYAGKGDVAKGQATLNDFLIRHAVQEQILAATTQGVIIGAAGFKTAYEPGTARPTDRTTLEVIPAWDMVLDESCTNIGRERYRGVIVWMPKQEAEAKYGVKLRGIAKTQPTAGLITAEVGDTNSGQAAAGYDQTALSTESAGAADGEWVQVLEFYNLVDPMRTRAGNTFLGRFEIWILNQPDGLSDKPIRVEAMPFARTSGKPLPPLRPLIFASHPIYPYRHISILERVMPQIRELNIFRSINAMQARRSAGRIYGMVEGVVEQDQADSGLSGEDSIVFKIKGDYKGSPKDALFAIDPPREDPATKSHIAALAQEFTWATGQSPNSRGEITEATKYEVQAANRFTEMELKRYATQLYAALGDVAQVSLRAIILAMQDASDSTAGYSPDAATSTREVADDVSVSAVGAVRSDAVVDAAVQDAAEDPTAAGETPSAADTRATVAPVEAKDKTVAQSPSAMVIQPFPIRIDGVVVMVTKDDLDADFEIQFVDGVRTPMREDARKEAQLKLVDVMANLWKQVKAGDVLARAQMETICDAFELPASWRPKALDEAEAATTAKKTPKAPAPRDTDVTEEGAPSEPSPPPEPSTSGIDLLTTAKQQLESGDVEGAAATLLPVGKSIPQVGAMLAEAAKSEDPGAALLHIVNQLLAQAGGAADTQAPPQP